MAEAVQTRPTGFLRVVTPEGVTAAQTAALQEKQAAVQPQEDLSGLAGHIRTQYHIMRLHRDNQASGWSHRLLNAMRVFNGQYSAEKLNEIAKFGGSQVYARLVAMKCRGASSLLRDIYLSSERAWGLEPTPDPDIPDDVKQSIAQLVQGEMSSFVAQGVPPPSQQDVQDRVTDLFAAAREAAKKKMVEQTKIGEEKLEEILKEGGFYNALAEFLVDLPLFPYACLKGPTVKIVPTVVWAGGKASVQNKAKLFWGRVSPFDLYWSPGVSDIKDAACIERTRVTRADLNDLLDLPGYNTANVRAVLDAYGSGGLYDNWDSTDAERANLENRENPWLNRTGMIHCLEWHGNVQGKLLLDYGMDKAKIPDPLRDYFVQAWLIGQWVIKCQLSPSPRKRHPFYITSFEKVPGTPVGNALPDILADIQDVANAAARALVNNLSISSGPQAVINVDRLAPGENPEEMYPWKRWQVTSDPLGNNAQLPVSFFQPNSNAQELMGVYEKFTQIADDLSAIPRYLSGDASGGAGRTSSGLAMLMNNANKILQMVAANVDGDVMEPLLNNLYDMVMLTDTSGLLTGDEVISVRGVNVAIQKETQRSRQLEFLGLTANPMDIQIIGPAGRAEVLRAVADGLGLAGSKIVPSDDEIKAQQKQAQQTAAVQGTPGHAGMGDQAGQAQGAQPGQTATQDVGPRTNVAGGVG
jgi:hypothetical protein